MMYAETITQTQWSSTCSCPNPVTKQWLMTVNRLSQTIESTYGCVAVHLCSQQFESLLNDEAQALKQSQAWVRQILLYGGDYLIAFARTVIPANLYNRLGLNSLGEQPIGPRVLFQDPHCERSAFEYSALNIDNEHRQQMQCWVDVNLQDELYARRSQFYLQSEHLLITEVLLPLEQYPNSQC